MTEFRIFIKTLAKEADTTTVKSACERLKKYFDAVCEKRKSFPLTNPNLFTHSTCTLEPNAGDIDHRRGDVLVYITTSDKSLAKTHFIFNLRSGDAGGVTTWTPGGVLTEAFWDKIPSESELRLSDRFKRATVLANIAFHEIGHNKYTEPFLEPSGKNAFTTKHFDTHKSGGAILKPKSDMAAMMNQSLDKIDIDWLSRAIHVPIPQRTQFLTLRTRSL